MSEYQDPVDLVRRSFIPKSAPESARSPQRAHGHASARRCQEAGSPAPVSWRALGAGHFPARGKGSSTCTCWAPSRTWTPSTTSRCWRKCTDRSSGIGPQHAAPVDDDLGQTAFPIVGPLAKFKQCEGRHLDQRRPSPPVGDRRRDVRHQDDVYGARQPRSGGEVPAHRFPARRASVERRVGQLRIGIGHQSPELRGDDLRSRCRRPARSGRLELGISSFSSSGRQVSIRRRAGAV